MTVLRRAPLRLLLALLAGATLSLRLAARKPQPSTAALEGPDPSTPRRSLIADGETPDLFLLYTGDVIGYLDPCG